MPILFLLILLNKKVDGRNPGPIFNLPFPLNSQITNYFYPKKIPAKIDIKSAPYLHQKSANWELNMVLIYALVLMLLTKFVLNNQV